MGEFSNMLQTNIKGSEKKIGAMEAVLTLRQRQLETSNQQLSQVRSKEVEDGETMRQLMERLQKDVQDLRTRDKEREANLEDLRAKHEVLRTRDMEREANLEDLRAKHEDLCAKHEDLCANKLSRLLWMEATLTFGNLFVGFMEAKGLLTAFPTHYTVGSVFAAGNSDTRTQLEAFCAAKKLSLTAQELMELDDLLRLSRNQTAHKMETQEYYEQFLDDVKKTVPQETLALVQSLIKGYFSSVV